MIINNNCFKSSVPKFKFLTKMESEKKIERNFIEDNRCKVIFPEINRYPNSGKKNLSQKNMKLKDPYIDNCIRNQDKENSLAEKKEVTERVDKLLNNNKKTYERTRTKIVSDLRVNSLKDVENSFNIYHQHNHSDGICLKTGSNISNINKRINKVSPYDYLNSLRSFFVSNVIDRTRFNKIEMKMLKDHVDVDIVREISILNEKNYEKTRNPKSEDFNILPEKNFRFLSFSDKLKETELKYQNTAVKLAETRILFDRVKENLTRRDYAGPNKRRIESGTIKFGNVTIRPFN